MKSIFYSVLAYILIFCSVLLLSNTNNSVEAETLICSAESIQTTQNVNFYGSDNETLLYTAKVPYGSTLNSVKSRNLWYYPTSKSGNFNGLSYSYDPLTQYYSFNGTCTSDSWIVFSNMIYLDAGTYTLSNYVISGKLTGSGFHNIFIHFLNNSNWFACSMTNDFVTFTIEERTVIDIVFSGATTRIFDNYVVSVQLEKSNVRNSWVPGYDDLNEYVNEQYLKSAGVSDMSTPVSWSTSKESNNMFPFNVPITQDYNLYGYVNDGETITYEGELTSRVSDIGNYALTDIVSLNIEGYYLVRGTIDLTYGMDFLLELYESGTLTTFNNRYNALILNGSSDYYDMNTLLVSAGSSMYEVGNGSFSISAFANDMADDFKGLMRIEFDSNSTGIFYVYFSNYAFDLYSDNGVDKWRVVEDSPYSLQTNYMFTENLNYLVDMDSSTNFSYSLLNEQDKTPFLNHNSREFFSYNIFSRDMLYYYSSESIGNSELKAVLNGGSVVNIGSNYDKLEIRNMDFYTDIVDYNYKVDDYYFIVDKPSYRVNNSLLFYNFDYYNTLNNVNKVVYELSKNGNYYDIVYNGSIPNYKFLYIENEEINNTVFDRYIFMHLTFNDNNTINLLQNGQYLPYYVGFDFNFAYYVEPLIADVSTFDYDFDKPAFKDMSIHFSVIPPRLSIPWNAIVYNVVVLIAFYFPLVSQIFEMLGLNYFLGGLLNVIDFVFANSLGNFVLGCLSFIIFFRIMLWFFPLAYQVGKSAIQSTSYYKGKQLEKDYQNYSSNRRKNDYMKNRYDNENKKE